MCGVSTDLSTRYGAAPSWRRPLVLLVVAVLVVAFTGWLAWVVYDASTPAVRSKLAGFEVVSDSQVRAELKVALADDAEDPECRLQAQGPDHEVVGETVFTPADGVNEVEFRTARGAVSVKSLGCTAEGQDRPK